MSRFFFKDISITDSELGAPYADLIFKTHPIEGRYTVCLDYNRYGEVFKTPNGDWGALPYRTRRGQPLNGFANRHYAAHYCLWAAGVIPESNKP